MPKHTKTIRGTKRMIELLSTETKPVYIGYNKLAAEAI